MRAKNLLLAVDMGGTKTNLGLYPAALPLQPLQEATCKTKDYPDAQSLVSRFLADCGHPRIQTACLGVPGPVFNNHSATTNLPWLIDGDALASALEISRLTLVNDLTATATAIPTLAPDELYTINPGREREGNMAVLSPGTGLGEAYLTIGPDHLYTAHASEGGHSDFAPNTPQEVELLVWLQDMVGHVSYEQVCSSLGLINIYNFLKRRGGINEPEWLAEMIRQAEDPSRVIIECSLDPKKNSELCRETMRIFVSVLGAEAGNLALKLMASGGVYIGGGITHRITGILDSQLFLKNFLNKGRLGEMLSRIPVRVIMNPKAPMRGAALLALASRR